MTVQQIDTFLATHYLSEDGFVPYPGVTTGNAIDALVELLQSIANDETWERVLDDYRNDPYGDGWADGIIRYEQDGAAYAAWLETKWEYPL